MARRNKTRKSSAAVRSILRELGSSRARQATRAHEALVDLGSSAVPFIVDHLDEDDPNLQLRVIAVLAEIADPAASNPLIGLLHDRCPRVRQRAAWALGRVPARACAGALEKLLKREKVTSVRLSATRSLVRLVMSGHQTPIRPLIQMIADPQETARLRTTALNAVPYVVQQEDLSLIRALLGQLLDDEQASVAAKARKMLDSPPSARLEPWAVAALLDSLASPQRTEWKRAENLLIRGGSTVIEPLVESMLGHGDDPKYARRCAQVLAAMPVRQQNRIGAYLDTVETPIPLAALVSVVAHSESQMLRARLEALINRLAKGPDANGPGPLHNVRKQAHTVLAESNCRLAWRDLHFLLEDSRYPVSVEVARAAGRVGAAQEVPSLVRAYLRSKSVTRAAVADAIRGLVRRERIRRADTAAIPLTPRERKALKEVLAGGGSARARRRAVRRGQHPQNGPASGS